MRHWNKTMLHWRGKRKKEVANLVSERLLKTCFWTGTWGGKGEGNTPKGMVGHGMQAEDKSIKKRIGAWQVEEVGAQKQLHTFWVGGEEEPLSPLLLRASLPAWLHRSVSSLCCLCLLPWDHGKDFNKDVKSWEVSFKKIKIEVVYAVIIHPI